jgi:outer membrane protein OmpA-like peptidoglycan-associated protein
MNIDLRKAMLLAIVCTLVCSLLPVEAYADRTSSKWSIQLCAGLRQPTFNHLHQPWVLSATYDATVYHSISRIVSLGVMFSNSRVYNDPESAATVKFGHGNADAYWKNSCLGVAGKVYLYPEGNFAPHLKFGSGLSSWKVISMATGRPQVVKASDGTETDYKATEIFFMTGVGSESFIHRRWSIYYGLEFFYLTGIGADFDRETNDGRSRGFLNLQIGLVFYFGPREKSLWEKWRDGEEERQERREPSQFIKREPGGGEPDDTLRQTDRDIYADSDYDGVRNEIDLCPDTPPEAAEHVDETGCPTDADSDGIPDYRDECFNTPLDMPVDSAGCPLDEDSDGVPDPEDKCSDTPKGYKVDRQGCVDTAVVFARRVLHFNYPPGGSNLSREGAIHLDSLVQLLTDFEGVRIEIYGYTDNIGEEEANLRLSQKRADKIKGFLVLQGIDKDRIKAIGKGETDFVASNADKYGRQKNRRIEIRFEY